MCHGTSLQDNKNTVNTFHKASLQKHYRLAQLRKLLLVILLLGISSLFAQQAVFVGIITDEYAQPIDNVVVTVEGTELSTVSSETGKILHEFRFFLRIIIFFTIRI